MGRFKDATTDDSGETGIDMSPLIDCVFILLIFFIVTTVFVEETGVEVDRPEAAASSQLEKNSVLIALTADGQVIFDKTDIGVHNVASVVKRKITKEMMPVIIQADRNAPAGTLVKIVGAARSAGAETVSVASLIGK